MSETLGPMLVLARQALAPELGALVNRVRATDCSAPWAFGVSDLMRNLAARQLLPTARQP